MRSFAKPNLANLDDRFANTLEVSFKELSLETSYANLENLDDGFANTSFKEPSLKNPLRKPGKPRRRLANTLEAFEEAFCETKTFGANLDYGFTHTPCGGRRWRQR